MLLLAGTAVVLLAAGVFSQIFWGEEAAVAGPERGPQNESEGVKRIRNKPEYFARVNEQLISQNLVAEECVARYGQEVLDNIVNRTIIQQACKKQGIVITAVEVDEEIVRIAKKFNLSVENWFQMLQAERNLTPRQYRRDIIWPMLALKKIAGERVRVTDEDMRKGFLHDYGVKVKAKLIMLDNFRRAQSVWEKVHKHPERFGEFAREYSIESNSRALDGQIPPIRQHSGNENLEKAAFALRDGQVSGIIQIGQSQFAILLCEGRTRRTVSFEEVKESLEEHLLESKVQESVAKVFRKLKEEAVVHNYLTGITTGNIRQTSGTKRAARSRPTDRSRSSDLFPEPSGRNRRPRSLPR
jgi:foldase protein PrsA